MVCIIRMKRAVVLLSGGLDSATVLAMARADGFACHALSFRYGQRHAVELDAAAEVARALGAVEHRVATVDLGWIGGSALTASEIAVPKDRSVETMGAGDIPITYVPARNALFLCHALAWAEVLGARDLYAGMNVLDYSGYPDCRPEYIAAFERMANLATRGGVEGTTPIRIQTPLLHLTKREIVQLGHSLGVDYAMTLSCYDPSDSGEACGHCDACTLRLKGFTDAGTQDPAAYVAPPNDARR
jgi:7-cyano-7-deazaguanine synthase